MNIQTYSHTCNLPLSLYIADHTSATGIHLYLCIKMNGHIIVVPFGTESGNVLPLCNEGEMGKSFPGTIFFKFSLKQYTVMRS